MFRCLIQLYHFLSWHRYTFHRLTSRRGVYLFRYFLSLMCTPNILFVICLHVHSVSKEIPHPIELSCLSLWEANHCLGIFKYALVVAIFIYAYLKSDALRIYICSFAHHVEHIYRCSNVQVFKDYELESIHIFGQYKSVGPFIGH